MNLGGNLDVNLGGKTHNLVTNPLDIAMAINVHFMLYNLK